MDENRRTILKSLTLGLAVIATPFAGFSQYFKKKRLRPPCALDEKDFLASCIKCGQCIQVCPVKALKPADIDDGFGIGAPYIDARAQSCDFSCDVIQCALACPTGALSYHKNPDLTVRIGSAFKESPVLLAKKSEPDAKLNMTERMGLAYLAHPESCLAKKGQGFKGTPQPQNHKALKRYINIDRWKPQTINSQSYDRDLCDLCVTECPIEGAISMVMSEHNGQKMGTPVVTDKCVGCGTCEMMCPTATPSIQIDARGVWL